MKTRLLLLSALLVAGAFAPVKAATITVLNPGFEAPVVGDPNSTGTATSWTGVNVGGAPGVYDPPVTVYPTVPEGVQVAYAQGGSSLSQLLGANETANTLYTLRVFVGRRLDQTSGPQAYTIQLLAGATTLINSVTPIMPAAGTFAEVVLNFTSPSSVAASQQLQVRLIGSSVTPQTNFDNVRLDANVVPTPSAALGGLALLGLMAAGTKLKSRMM